MPGKQKQKKQKQEDQPSSVSENANDYQKDDFVVDSADDDNSQEQLDSDGEEYNSLELSEDDYQLIEENKKKKKQINQFQNQILRGRLQRKADSSDEEAEYKDDSEYREGEELSKKKVKQKSISDDLEVQRMDEELGDDEEDIPNEKKRQVLEEFFDPHQRQALGLQDNDEKIIEKDLPERVQLQNLNILGKLPDDLGQREPATEEEVQWVTERLLYERIIPIKPSEKTVFTEGVRIVLDLFRKENVEVQFVITYKKYYITPLLWNEHIWRIQELDIQWEIFSSSKSKLQQKLQDLKKSGCQLSQIIEKYLNESILEQQLSDMSEYLKYIEIRQKCLETVRNFKVGNLEQLLASMSINQQKSREYFLCQAFFLKIDELANKVLLKVEDFAELLAGNTLNLNHWIGKNQEMNFDKVKEWIQPDQNLVKDSQNLILTLQKYVKQEMFIHPVVRHYIWLEYQRYTSVSTTPTATGIKEVTALNYLYPVKRIKNRPVKYMEDESYLMLLKAEELDYVETKFRVQEVQKQEKNQYVDQIMITIQQKFKELPGMVEKSQGEKEKTNRIENLRDFILRQFLLEQMYPFLEQRMREHLKEQGNISVLRHCCKEFHLLINQEPHQSSQEEQQQGQYKIYDENKKVMSLVLVNEENPRDNELAKTFTCSYSLEKKHIGMAIVDGKGEILNLQIFNYLLQNKQFKPNEPREKEMNIIQGLLAQYQPDVIVISANQTECIKLRADFRDEHLFSGKWWASLVDSSVSHIYALSEKSNQQLPETPQVLREAVSLARFKLSPLAEVLNIWDEIPDQNGCLNIQMHPLQKMLPQRLLQNELMKVACEVVCSIGVDPVDTALHPHLQSQVQFLAGLGSRKGRRFMQLMKAYLSNKYLENHYESERRIIQAIKNNEEQYIQLEKIDILKNGLFNRNVFKNLHGFLRIENGINPLDRTRLINSMYQDAAYMAQAALDIESRDEKDYTPIFNVMRQPKSLDDLELEEWALKKEKSNNIPQYIRVVQFMKNELTNPFQHHYEKSGEMSHKDIFYKATQETPYTLRKNSIVTGPIIQVKQDVICIRLSQSGLIGVLPKWEFQPERVTLEEFNEGQIIKAYVKSIEALSDEKQSLRQRQPGAMQEEKEKNKSVNVFRLELTLKPDWNPIEQLIVVVKPENWFRAYPYKDYEERIKKTFDLKEFKIQDCPQIQLATQPIKQQKLILRKINHPKFKQVMLKGAIEYIEGQKVGEYIIRPSSRGKEFLTITWKFFEGVLAHLLVKEEHRSDNFKPKLLLGKDEYETFDEIYERYIVPCNNHMEAAANNKKFSSEKIEFVEKRLKDEKELDTAIVPYGFCVTERAPQYLVLIYVPKDKVEKEYIKVKPEGLFFHGQVFSTLKQLTQFFKEEFRKPEYKSYLKRVKPPFSDADKYIAQINQNYLSQNEVKREKGKDEKIKYEGSDYSNIYCTKCSRRGHTANDCRGADKDKFRNKNDRSDSRPQRNSGTCFNCNQAGHVKKNCPQLNQQPSSRLTSQWDRNDNNQGNNSGWGGANSLHHRNRSRSRSRDRSQENEY